MTNTDTAWAEPAGVLFRSLSHEYRLMILSQLRSGPLSADQLAARTGISKPLLATHFTRLQRDNLISREGTGGKAVYALTGDPVLAILSEAERLFRDR